MADALKQGICGGVISTDVPEWKVDVVDVHHRWRILISSP
jgi:hypothetical protein